MCYILNIILPAIVGPMRLPRPSPTLKQLKRAGTFWPSITSEHDEYIAAIIGPPNIPRAERKMMKEILIFRNIYKRKCLQSVKKNYLVLPAA